MQRFLWVNYGDKVQIKEEKKKESQSFCIDDCGAIQRVVIDFKRSDWENSRVQTHTHTRMHKHTLIQVTQQIWLRSKQTPLILKYSKQNAFKMESWKTFAGSLGNMQHFCGSGNGSELPCNRLKDQLLSWHHASGRMPSAQKNRLKYKEKTAISFVWLLNTI